MSTQKRAYAVVLFSGGLDSTILLAHLIARRAREGHIGEPIIPIGFNYGQRHSIELERADEIARHFELEPRTLDMSFLGRFLLGSSQTDPNVPVPHGHYTAENMKATVVPNRNMVMISVAAAIGMANKARFVATAVHAGDHAIYPDCREEFIEAMDRAVRLSAGDASAPMLYTPFVRMSKAEIVKEALRLQGDGFSLPLSMTWSCYEGDSAGHCGKCGTCVERKEAFQLANAIDPTHYRG